MTDKDIQIYKTFQKSPLAFIEAMWKLTPERDNTKFVKGKHITAQQHDILLGIEKALRNEAPMKISVASGHGIGKTALLSWLILWHLFCHKDSQISATAPTAQQLYDALWKELAVWLRAMPKPIQSLYDLSASYLKIAERSETWFARAATARKEAPEAFAGIHGNYVMFIADEASGVFEEVFNVGRGALSAGNAWVILISNPTRLEGYFYDSQHSLKANWQTFQFNSLDSPLVSKQSQLVTEIVEKYGEDSDEYRIRILGQFPRADAMDDKGFMPVFSKERMIYIPEYDFSHTFSTDKFMGIDPAGEGRDKTTWVIRDSFGMKIIADEAISNAKSIAEKILTLMEYYNLRDENVFIDGFGIGAHAAREIFIAGRKINVVLTSEKPIDEKYLNLRAELGFRFSEWINTGGRLVSDKRWEELASIKFKRNLAGKIQIMDKVSMRKLYGKSPDYFDSGSLTFMRYEFVGNETSGEVQSYIPKHSYYKK